MIRFLFDECLSPALEIVAKQYGFEGAHVRTLRLLGAVDRELALTAILRDDILVTNNSRHFKRIYATMAAHPGLLIILPSVGRPGQVRLFTNAIAFIEAQPTVVDQVVSVRRDGTITIEPWPRRG